MTDVREWFNSLPIFTRYWFGLSVLFPLIGRFGLISPYYFILNWELVFSKFQLWRLVTSFFFYPLTSGAGFRLLTNLFFLYNYSIKLETGLFGGRPADYGFLLLFSWVNLVIVGLLAEIMILMDSMVMVVIYIWCQMNQEVVVTFWFGTRFKAMYLPWVVTIFEFVLSGSFWPQLAGILVGHLYYFLKYRYPIDFNGPSLLETPQWMYNYFPNQRGVSGIQGATYRRAEPRDGGGSRAGGGGHSWGRGNTLGSN
ncbi:hypothetical protein CHUAL_003994 [Chamberlinius hualienensis]